MKTTFSIFRLIVLMRSQKKEVLLKMTEQLLDEFHIVIDLGLYPLK